MAVWRWAPESPGTSGGVHPRASQKQCFSWAPWAITQASQKSLLKGGDTWPGQTSAVLVDPFRRGSERQGYLRCQYSQCPLVPSRTVLLPPVLKWPFLKCPVYLDWHFCKTKEELLGKETFEKDSQNANSNFLLLDPTDTKLLCQTAIKVSKAYS